MKLKKIASLALAGVMAVSMLAGCGDNSNNSSSTPTGDVEVTSTPVVVETLNKYQSVEADVQIDFTAASTSLMNKVAAAVDDMGTMQGTATANATALAAYLKNSTGNTNVVTSYVASSAAPTSVGFLDAETAANVPQHDGEKHTAYFVFAYGASTQNTDEAAAYAALTSANGLQAFIGDLLTQSNGSTALAPEEKYLAYTYTGSVGSVTAAVSTGAPIYYIVVEITQTATMKTAEK